MRPFSVGLWILKSAIEPVGNSAQPWYARGARVEFVQLPLYGGEQQRLLLENMMVNELHSTSTFVSDISVLLLRYLNGVPASEQVYAITMIGKQPIGGDGASRIEGNRSSSSKRHRHRKSKRESRASVTHIHLIRWMPKRAEWSPILKWRGNVLFNDAVFDTNATTRRSLEQIHQVFGEWIALDAPERGGNDMNYSRRHQPRLPAPTFNALSFNGVYVVPSSGDATHPYLFEYNDDAFMNAPPLLTSAPPVHVDHRMMVYRYPSFNRMLNIDDADMRHSRIIGKGGFSVIMTTKWRGIGKVVIKYVNMSKKNRDGVLVDIPAIKRAKYAYAEAAHGCSMNHANIAKYYGWFLHPANNYTIGIVMERLDMTLSHALGSYVKSSRSGSEGGGSSGSSSGEGDGKRRRPLLSQHQVLDVLKGINDALHHMHSNGFVHRDIKPANIMLDAAGVPKLIDLAFSIPIGSIAHAAGSSRYQPDIMLVAKNDGKSYEYFTHACDYYALAVLILDRIDRGIPMPRVLIECAQRIFGMINQRPESDPAPLPDLYQMVDNAIERCANRRLQPSSSSNSGANGHYGGREAPPLMRDDERESLLPSSALPPPPPDDSHRPRHHRRHSSRSHSHGRDDSHKSSGSHHKDSRRRRHSSTRSSSADDDAHSRHSNASSGSHKRRSSRRRRSGGQ